MKIVSEKLSRERIKELDRIVRKEALKDRLNLNRNGVATIPAPAAPEIQPIIPDESLFVIDSNYPLSYFQDMIRDFVSELRRAFITANSLNQYSLTVSARTTEMQLKMSRNGSASHHVLYYNSIAESALNHGSFSTLSNEVLRDLFYQLNRGM